MGKVMCHPQAWSECQRRNQYQTVETVNTHSISGFCEGLARDGHVYKPHVKLAD